MTHSKIEKTMKKLTLPFVFLILSFVSFAQEIAVFSAGASVRDTYSVEFVQILDEIVYSVEIGARDIPFGLKGKRDEEAKFSEFFENVKKTKHYYAGVEFGVGRRLNNWLVIGSIGYYPRYKVRSWYDPEEELGKNGHYYNVFKASHSKITLGIKVKRIIALSKSKKHFLAIGAKFSAFDGIGVSLGFGFNND